MKNSMTLYLILVFGVSISLCGCEKKHLPMADESGVTAEGVQSVINANNQFALELFSKYINDAEQKGKNVFYSPYSISSAMVVTYEGAKGQTAGEIQKIFHFPLDQSARRPAYAKIYNEINKQNEGDLPSKENDSQPKACLLSTANALWAQEDYPFLDEYVTLAEKYYGGKVTNLDFNTEAEESRGIINKWIKEQTNNRIKELVPVGAVGPDTRLILTNTVHFKGEWVHKFEKEATYDDKFSVDAGKTVNVEMMHMTEFSFNYAVTEQLQILEMLYFGNEWSMIILLPRENEMQSLERSLTIDSLNKWIAMLQEKEVTLFIPKFKFETKYFLKEPLMEMGMPSAFSKGADFSGMTGKNEFLVDNVIHQAFIEVNEEGTEASAVTDVSLLEGIPEETDIFRADHPFVFIIQQRATGNILFVGKLMDPTQ